MNEFEDRINTTDNGKRVSYCGLSWKVPGDSYCSKPAGLVHIPTNNDTGAGALALERKAFVNRVGNRRIRVDDLEVVQVLGVVRFGTAEHAFGDTLHIFIIKAAIEERSGQPHRFAGKRG